MTTRLDRDQARRIGHVCNSSGHGRITSRQVAAMCLSDLERTIGPFLILHTSLLGHIIKGFPNCTKLTNDSTHIRNPIWLADDWEMFWTCGSDLRLTRLHCYTEENRTCLRVGLAR